MVEPDYGGTQEVLIFNYELSKQQNYGGPNRYSLVRFSYISFGGLRKRVSFFIALGLGCEVEK